MKHKFVRCFMSGLTTLELWKCYKCGVTAESNWNDKLGKRERRKINGTKECPSFWDKLFKK